MTRPRLLVPVLVLLLAALPARADNDFGTTRPWGLLTAGLGLPGFPGYAVEALVGNEWSVTAEGGTGLVGAFGSLGGRWRPCWGCADGAGFALGLGPELTVIPYGEAARTAFYLTAVVQPAFVYRFTDHFGLTAGVKIGIGSGVEWSNNDDGTKTYLPFELVNIFSLYAGVQL